MAYHLDLETNLLENSFRGQVDIVLQGSGPKQFRRNIILHAGSNLDIKNVELSLTYQDNLNQSEYIKIKSTCHDDQYDILVIEIDETELDAISRSLSTITAQIRFEGHPRMNGYGLVSINHANQEEADLQVGEGPRSYMYTRFGRFGAHFLFPCFDEARFKSTYSLRLSEIAPEMDAVSISEPIAVDTNANGAKNILFAPTIPISVNHFGFALGEFSHTRVMEFYNDQLTIDLYNRPEIIEPSSVLRSTIIRAYDLLSNYFAMSHPSTKINLVAIRGIGESFGANMAGLIVVDYTLLNHQESEDNLERTASFVASIVEIMARQWIGYIVTLDHDEENWFFEGIIGVIGLQLADRIYPKMSYRLSFTRRVISPNLNYEALPDVEAPLSETTFQQLREEMMVTRETCPSAIDIGPNTSIGCSRGAVRGEFDLTNRQKLRAIIIMMIIEEGCNPVNFQRLLQRIVRIYSTKVIHLCDFTHMVQQECHFKPDTSIKLLRNFTGFPLLEAHLLSPNYLVIKQEKFNNDYSSQKQNERRTKDNWAVPVTYTFGHLNQNRIRQSSSTLFRVRYDFRISLPPDYDVNNPGIWVKLNNSFRGFYRVLYSDHMLHLLKQAAYANKLSEIDCFNLLDDARAIFRSGKRGAYYLIDVMIGMMNNPSEMIQEELLMTYKELRSLYQPTNVVRIIERLNQIGTIIFGPRYGKQGLSLGGLSSRYSQNIRAEIFKLLAMLDYPPLVQTALQLYESNIFGELDDRLHDAILITVTRHGDESEFDELLDLLRSEGIQRSEALEYKLIIACALSKSSERFIKSWMIIKNMEPDLVSLFIEKLLETSEGSAFVMSTVLPELASMFNQLGPDRVQHLLQLMCMNNSCGPMTDLIRLLGHERWLQLIEDVTEKRRRNYFLQQVDLNKLIL